MSEFLGKLHLLFLHLPIGFLILLGILEWFACRPRWKEIAAANRLILLFLIPATIATAGCGWLLAAHGKYHADTLFWHRWLGVSVAVATVILWVIRQRGWLTAYRRSLFVTLILLTVASHLGGTLTHGSDFLAWPRSRSPAAKPVTDAERLAQPVYASVIHPIFDQYCVSCHGADKSKGGLRLDTVAHLVQGGDSGSLFDPPGAEKSLLGIRLSLPLDDEDHMPPDGKPQLSAAQLTVIRWWLDAGAPTDKQLGELQPNPEILQSIQTLSAASAATK